MYCICAWVFYLMFFFKQKTAYEMRISDWSSDVCSSDLLLHHVHHAVVERRGLHPAVVVELLPGLGHRRLVGDGHHAHPAAQHAQCIHHVERLRAAADLHHRERATLRGPHAAVFTRQPVDLVLDHTRDRHLPLGDDHTLALGPQRTPPPFLPPRLGCRPAAHHT